MDSALVFKFTVSCEHSFLPLLICPSPESEQGIEVNLAFFFLFFFLLIKEYRYQKIKVIYPKSHSKETAQLVPRHRLPSVWDTNLQQQWPYSPAKMLF